MKSKSTTAPASSPAPTVNVLPAAGPAGERNGRPGGRAARPVPPSVRLDIELAVPAGTHPELLAEARSAVARHGVTVLAYCTSFHRDRFTILLVTSNAAAAKHALADAGLSCTARSIVLVQAENRPETPAILCQQLGEARIDIEHAYVAVAEPQTVYAVFRTVHNEQAVRVLAAAAALGVVGPEK